MDFFVEIAEDSQRAIFKISKEKRQPRFPGFSGVKNQTRVNIVPENHSRKIRLLDPQTINQIAAGEVIENASSVVKELIENAIDAGAQSLFIETQAGGRQLIRVSDDGCGLQEEDLILCLERHATSKITSSDDLFSLNTLGFRGEAIPSIASVSKFSLHSSTGNFSGHIVFVEGGKVTDSRPLPRQKGTSVEVKNLFYNVPVRKKFLRGIAAETADIHRVILRTALCYPSLHIHWKHDDKLQLETHKGQDLRQRAEQLLGQETFGEMIELEAEEEGISLKGILSSPSVYKGNRSGQYLFVNNRPLHSDFLSDCVLGGYGSRLPTHRYPLFVLHLHLPPADIDINVHPQKKEARFRNPEFLRQFLLQAVENALQSRHLPSYSFELRDPVPLMVSEPLTVYSLPTTSVPRETTPEMVTAPTQLHLEEPPPSLEILGWVGGYALLQWKEMFYLLDSKAAQSRVYFDHHQESHSEELEVQNLLFPLTLHFSSQEAKQLETFLDSLSKLGLHLRSLGSGSFALDSLPVGLEEDQISSLLESLLEANQEESHPQQALLKICKTFRRKPLDHEKLHSLFDALLQTSNPFECPFGEKTFIPLQPALVEKIFQKL